MHTDVKVCEQPSSAVVLLRCVSHPPSILKKKNDEFVAVGLLCIKVLLSESGGFLIGADYTAVARKMMTRSGEGC